MSEDNIEHKRFRLQMKVIEKVPLCHAVKSFSDEDNNYDFWVLKCDLDYGHAGDHLNKRSKKEWLRDKDDPESTKEVMKKPNRLEAAWQIANNLVDPGALS